jgi:hypothetical protein
MVIRSMRINTPRQSGKEYNHREEVAVRGKVNRREDQKGANPSD